MLLALPLCHSSNLSPMCLFGHMPIRPWILHRYVSLSELSLPPFLYVLVSVVVYDFYFQVKCWMLYSPMGAQPLVFASLQPFGAYLWQAYVQPGDDHWPTPGMHRWLLPPLLSVGGAYSYSISCLSAIPAIWWGIQLWGLDRVT